MIKHGRGATSTSACNSIRHTNCAAMDEFRFMNAACHNSRTLDDKWSGGTRCRGSFCVEQETRSVLHNSWVEYCQNLFNSETVSSLPSPPTYQWSILISPTVVPRPPSFSRPVRLPVPQDWTNLPPGRRAFSRRHSQAVYHCDLAAVSYRSAASIAPCSIAGSSFGTKGESADSSWMEVTGESGTTATLHYVQDNKTIWYRAMHLALMFQGHSRWWCAINWINFQEQQFL